MFMDKNLRVLEFFTGALLDFAGAENDLYLSYGALPPGVAGCFEVTDRGPTIIINTLALMTCQNHVDILFIAAHELGHYVQWRDGRLGPASSLDKQPVTMWDGVVMPHSAAREAPWEMDADKFAIRALDFLEDIVRQAEAPSQAS